MQIFASIIHAKKRRNTRKYMRVLFSTSLVFTNIFPDYVWYLNEPCKILISEVKIIPNENVVYDKKNRSYNVKSEIL